MRPPIFVHKTVSSAYILTVLELVNIIKLLTGFPHYASSQTAIRQSRHL